MNKLFTLLIALVVLLSPVLSQEKNFEKTFDKEINKKGRLNSPKFKHISIPWQPAELPGWFFSPPQNGLYAIGISDPDMPRDSAYAMATVRAKAILGLLNKARVRYVKDSYSSVHEDTRSSLYKEKFDTYSKFDTKFKGDVEIVDTFFTVYNEAIVLVKMKRDRRRNKRYVKADIGLVTIEFVYGDRFEYQNKYELEIKEYKGKSVLEDVYYNLYEVNKRYNYISRYQNQEFDCPGFYYKYNYPPAGDKPVYVDNGLWKEYVKSFLREIQLMAEVQSFHLQQTGDSYSGKDEKLYRQTANKNFSFTINNLSFKGDTLKLDLNGMILAK